MTPEPFPVNNTATHPTWLMASAGVLHDVERLPIGATGALTFGDEGMVLVENKRICWAVARGMERRLTDLLCEQRDLPRATVEELYRRCKREQKPLGQTLVESALVSYRQVRCALERHNCEALRQLARSLGDKAVQFSPLASRGYDARLVFSPAQLFAALSHRRYPERTESAAQWLRELATPDVHCFAFVRDPCLAQPVLLAVDELCTLRIAQISELGRWTSRALDVASFVDKGAQVVAAPWCEHVQLVAFRIDDLHYTAVCTSRPSAALLLNQLVTRVLSSATLAESATAPKVRP